MTKFANNQLVWSWIWNFVMFIVWLLDAAQAGVTDLPPLQFMSQPQSGNPLIPGSTKVLLCTADGLPLPDYRWMKDQQLMSNTPAAAVNTGSLKIRNIAISDAATYRCIAFNHLGAVRSQPADVHVAYIKPFSDSANTERYVSEGDAVIFDLPPVDSCPAASIQWVDARGKLIPRTAESHHVTLTNQLVILNMTYALHNNAMFRATATNGYTQQTSSSPLYVLRVRRGSGDIAPYIVVAPTDTVAVQGVDEAVEFECVVNARRPSYVRQRWYWKSDDGQTTDLSSATAGGKYMFSSRFRRLLTIKKLTVADAGVYRCEATYHTSSGPDVTFSAEAQLTVYVRPMLTESPPHHVQQKVESWTSLPCAASGSPQPAMHWYRNAVLVNDTDRMYVVGNGSLIVTSSLENDSAVYQCFAVNDVGETSATVLLTVFSIAPFFVDRPHNETVVMGTSLRLVCRVSGAPRPTVTWSRVFSSASNTVEHVSSGSELLLTDVSLSDTGTYMCTASNRQGSATARVTVTVTVRTRIVRPVSTVSAVEGDRVSMSCVVDSDPHYTVTHRWYHNSSLISVHSPSTHAVIDDDGSLVLQSLSKADAGLYTCMVDSGGGHDNSSGWLHIIERPASPWLLSASLTSQPHSVQVMWLADFGGRINKFNIYAKPVVKGMSGTDCSQDVVNSVSVDNRSSSIMYSVHDLQPGCAYQVIVTAENEAGEGPPSQPSSILTIPEECPADSPRLVQIVSNTSSSAAVCWQLPNRSDWNGYLRGCMVRYRQLKPITSSFSSVNVTDINQQCIFIDELQESGEYEASVSCFNAACLSPFSDSFQFVVHDEVLHTPPTNVTVVPLNSTSICVTFLPPHFTDRSDLYYMITASRNVTDSTRRLKRNVVSDESENRVEKDSAGTVTVRGRLLHDSMQTDTVTGLDKFTSYHVTVHCLTHAAAGPVSSVVTVHTLDDVPSEVASLSVIALSNSSVYVTWTQPLQPNGLITGYVLTYLRAGSAPEIVQLQSGVHQYVIEAPEPVEYTIYIAAVTRHGAGPTRFCTVVPVIQLKKMTSSFTGWSTQSLLPTDALQTGRMLSSNFSTLSDSSSSSLSSSLSDSSSSPLSDPVNELLAHSQETGAAGDKLSGHWWIVLLVVLVVMLTIALIICIICFMARSRRREQLRVCNGNVGLKQLLTETHANTAVGSSSFVDNESGVTTIERRRRWSHARYSNSATLPMYTRAPPRPSPGSIQYDGTDVEMHQMLPSLHDDEDSVNVSERVLQEAEEETRQRTLSLHRRRSHLDTDSVRPHSLSDTCVVDNSAPACRSNDSHMLRSVPSSTFRPAPPPVLSSFT